MYSIHATKKLLDRVKQPIEAPVEHLVTVLGNWYATALFWKPQAALFVNERTLVPVFVPLAPAAKLARRYPSLAGGRCSFMRRSTGRRRHGCRPISMCW